MPMFYRGAGVGTYWHTNDACQRGFTPQVPGMAPSIHRLMVHVARGTVTSPYVSLTRSYGVAWSYAVFFGRMQPTHTTPAYVYELEINDPLPPGLQLLDPVKAVAAAAPSPLQSISYQHDGLPNFLLGVVDPMRMKQFLHVHALQPPPGGGTSRPPHLTMELEALVRALRDAEILAVGNVPTTCVRTRYPVW
jgi:hypothetical protein